MWVYISQCHCKSHNTFLFHSPDSQIAFRNCHTLWFAICHNCHFLSYNYNFISLRIILLSSWNFRNGGYDNWFVKGRCTNKWSVPFHFDHFSFSHNLGCVSEQPLLVSKLSLPWKGHRMRVWIRSRTKCSNNQQARANNQHVCIPESWMQFQPLCPWV